MKTFAVIGGGLAGLACARTLAGRGQDVVVLDKGRAPGGRLSRISSGHATWDAGASNFTVREARFRAEVARWERDGHCARWTGRVGATEGDGHFVAASAAERWVGTPSMNALARALADGLTIRSGHRVDAIRREESKLLLDAVVSADGRTLAPAGTAPEATEVLGPFDEVVVCVPAPQAASLVAASEKLLAVARAVTMTPCLATFFETDADAVRSIPYDGIFVGRDDAHTLSWVVRENSKPGRASAERWSVHAGARFSRAHENDAADATMAAMLDAFRDLFVLKELDVTASAFKRWRLAKGGDVVSTAALVDRPAGLSLAGDWTREGRVEGAYLSGVAVAEHLLDD